MGVGGQRGGWEETRSEPGLVQSSQRMSQATLVRPDINSVSLNQHFKKREITELSETIKGINENL